MNIGKSNNLPPILLMANIRGLVGVHKEPVFPKSEEMLDIISLSVCLIRIRQGYFPVAFSDYDQPQRLFEYSLSIAVFHRDSHQGERMLMHGNAMFAAHEHIVPGFYRCMANTTVSKGDRNDIYCIVIRPKWMGLSC